MGTVGETLAAERRRQGKTIADVEAGTKIMSRMLDAIEDGRYEELPSPVYVKGYLQSYAQFLGMDMKPIVDAYKRETSLTDPEDKLRIPDRAVVKQRDQLHAVSLNTWLIVAGAVVLIGLALWAASGLFGNEPATSTIPPVATETVDATETVLPGETSETVEASAPAEETVGADTSFTMVVSVAEGSASWLRITVDGLKAYEGTLPGGETQEWIVTDAAEVIIGQPSAVTVTRDGTEVPIETADGRGSVTLNASDE